MSQENTYLFNQPITKSDLIDFRNNLLSEIKELLSGNQNSKEWLKSCEVRKILKISPSTLQNLRVNGSLQYTKVGSIIYYKYEDIEKMLSK